MLPLRPPPSVASSPSPISRTGSGGAPRTPPKTSLGKPVLLETSGERDISSVDPRVHRIVDLKAPGSGESHNNRWQNLELLTQRDECKVVLLDRNDYDWARDVIARERLAERVAEVLL